MLSIICKRTSVHWNNTHHYVTKIYNSLNIDCTYSLCFLVRYRTYNAPNIEIRLKNGNLNLLNYNFAEVFISASMHLVIISTSLHFLIKNIILFKITNALNMQTHRCVNNFQSTNQLIRVIKRSFFTTTIIQYVIQF